jgi:hypothetical protein
MLMNLLNSHPAIHCNSDILTRDVREHGEEWTYRQGFRLPPKYPTRSPLPPGKVPTWIGFQLKMKQDLHRTIRRRRDLKIVLLQRRNRLASLLSRNVTHRLGSYESPERGISLEDAPLRRAEMPPFRIEVREARAFFEEWSAKTDEVLRCLEGTDWVEVFYEELCQDAAEAMRPVYEHLGVPFHPVSHTAGWGAVKLDLRPLSQAIENYEELRTHFLGTPWQEFFVT